MAARKLDQQQDEKLPAGARVRIIRGKEAGRQGTVRRVFRGRTATPDHVFIAGDDMLPGWTTSVPVDDVEVLP